MPSESVRQPGDSYPGVVPAPRIARPTLVALAALVAAATAISAGCSADHQRTALAIDEIVVHATTVRATTECADDVTAEVRPDPKGSGLLEVSLWGRPKVGRCHPSVDLDDVPTDTAKVVDGATSQVIDVAS